MTTLVESLQRLYKAGRLTETQIAQRVERGTISIDDYKAITGEIYNKFITGARYWSEGTI